MATTCKLKLPLDEAAVRSLRIGDMVELSGELVLIGGMPTHERLLEFLASGEALPIDLRDAAVLHFGGYNLDENGEVKLLYLNPTTSSRFNPYMPKLIRGFGLRLVGGKGGLDAASAAAMQATGCVYLSFPGGGCTLFTNAIREVVSVAWKDLIVHYRLVKLRVEGLGPGTVAIDAHGNSLYDGLQTMAEERLPEIMRGLNAARAASKS